MDTSLKRVRLKQSRVTRPRRDALILLGMLLASSMTAVAADRYEGLAYAKDSGALAYRETHWLYEDEGRAARLVVYSCPDGTPFARKHILVEQDAIAPDFDFLDARDGYAEGVRGDGDHREVYWQLQRDVAAKRRRVEIGANTVVDAGFDTLIRRRWDALEVGNVVTAAFLLPSHLDLLNISIRKVAGATAANEDAIRLRMKLDAWYGFAVPQTELVYRASDRWLLRFDGIGSIRDDRGHNQAVRIEFPPGALSSGVAREEIDEALAMPLNGRCRG